MSKQLVATLTTDSNGEATFTYTGTGIGKVGFNAKYGTFQSEIYEVLDCLVKDNATSTDHNDCWETAQSGVITRNATNTSLTGNQWSYVFLKVNNNKNIPVSDYIMEFDTNTVTNACSFTLYDGTSHALILSSNKHYKLVITDKIYPYVDDVAQNPISINPTTSTYQWEFVLRENNAELQFKNVKVYPI